MARTLLLVALLLPVSTAEAGRIHIGRNTLNGGVKIGTCHVTIFTGPEDSVTSYIKSQKERFEEPDQSVIESMRGSVSVVLLVETLKRPDCARNSGIPQRIVLTEKKGTDPIFAIDLKANPVTLSNMAGARFDAMNASGEVPVEKFRALAGKEYDFHLIYADSKYRDDWKKDYAEKVLKPEP